MTPMDDELLKKMRRTLDSINSDNEGESWVSRGYLATQMFEWVSILVAEVERLQRALDRTSRRE